MAHIEPQEDIDYDDVFESISNDARRRGLSDDKVWEIWQAGLAAQQSVQRTGQLSGLLEGEYKVDWISDDVVYLTPQSANASRYP